MRLARHFDIERHWLSELVRYHNWLWFRTKFNHKRVDNGRHSGIGGKQSFLVVQASMKAAIETGDKVSDVANTLAAAMRDFKLPGKDAGQ
jgi:hypothetical protein